MSTATSSVAAAPRQLPQGGRLLEAEAQARVELAEVDKIPASIGRELGDALLEAILTWKARQSTATKGAAK